MLVHYRKIKSFVKNIIPALNWRLNAIFLEVKMSKSDI